MYINSLHKYQYHDLKTTSFENNLAFVVSIRLASEQFKFIVIYYESTDNQNFITQKKIT